MNARYSYLSHLQCSLCQHSYTADQLSTISPCCSRPLLAQYDLSALASDVTKNDFVSRESTMWRYHELLPVSRRENLVSHYYQRPISLLRELKIMLACW